MEIKNCHYTPPCSRQGIGLGKDTDSSNLEDSATDLLEDSNTGSAETEHNVPSPPSRTSKRPHVPVGLKMHLAAGSDNTSEVLAMLQSGVSPNEKYYVCTPLRAAIRREAVNTMKLLLDWNADIEDRGRPPSCDTMLHEAITECNVTATKMLLDRGANVWAHREPFDPTLIEMGTCDALIYAEGVAEWYPEGEELCRLVREAMAKQPRPKARVHSPPSSPSARKKPKTIPS